MCFTLVVLWCGQTGEWMDMMYGHMTTKISRTDREPHFLSYGAPLACVREALLIST